MWCNFTHNLHMQHKKINKNLHTHILILISLIQKTNQLKNLRSLKIKTMFSDMSVNEEICLATANKF